jgi:hypothetical protein
MYVYEISANTSTYMCSKHHTEQPEVPTINYDYAYARMTCV